MNLGSGSRQPAKSTSEPKSPLVSRSEYPLTHRVADQMVFQVEDESALAVTGGGLTPAPTQEFVAAMASLGTKSGVQQRNDTNGGQQLT